MSEVRASEARESFPELVNRAAYGRERVIIVRRGKRLAAVVPVEDVDLLEALENRMDAEDLRRALRDAKRRGEKPIPWEKVKKDLGL